MGQALERGGQRRYRKKKKGRCVLVDGLEKSDAGRGKRPATTSRLPGNRLMRAGAATTAGHNQTPFGPRRRPEVRLTRLARQANSRPRVVSRRLDAVDPRKKCANPYGLKNPRQPGVPAAGRLLTSRCGSNGGRGGVLRPGQALNRGVGLFRGKKNSEG